MGKLKMDHNRLWVGIIITILLILIQDFCDMRSLAFMVVRVASDDAFPPSHVLTSPDCCLEPRPLLSSVRVLPALHQHHQGVEPEEDDDGDDDALQDDPDVDMARARHEAVVSQLLDRCRWVLEAEGVRPPNNEVQ